MVEEAGRLGRDLDRALQFKGTYSLIFVGWKIKQNYVLNRKTQKLISEYVPLYCSARSRSLPRRPASSSMTHYNPNGNVPHYVTLSRAALVESGDARMFEQHRYVIDSLFRQDSCVHKYVRWRTGSSHSNWLNLKVLNFSNLEFNFDSLPMLK